MEAMKIFENFIESNPDDPVDTTDVMKQPYSRFANGNFDEKGNDRINEGVTDITDELHR